MNTQLRNHKNQSGAAMLSIVLIIVIIMITMIGALSLGPRLKNITYERQTVQRGAVIVDALKQHYLARGELPPPESVPVGALNLEQKYKLDSWGQEWEYYRGTIDDNQTSRPDITRMEYNGLRVAGVIISGGPDQRIGSTVTWNGDDWIVNRPANVNTTEDDIIIPINVQGEAIQIAKDELNRLSRFCPVYSDDLGLPHPWDVETQQYSLVNDWSEFLRRTGLGTAYRDDPWMDNSDNQRYIWESLENLSNPETAGEGRWVTLGSAGVQRMYGRTFVCDYVTGREYEPGNGTDDPVDPFVDENVFVSGTSFSGLETGSPVVEGDGATIVLTHDLELGGAAKMNVSSIYVSGNVTLKGSSTIGSEINPGIICIDGDLNLGVSNNIKIFGTVYIKGDFHPGGAKIHGNVYVSKDVRLDTFSGSPPEMIPDTNRIYYAGHLYTGNQMQRQQFAENYCVYSDNLPSCPRPVFGTLVLRSDSWYDVRGYEPSGELISDIKIFSHGDYDSGTNRQTATNVVIVSKGDITITMNLGANVKLTGVLFAPYGKVSFTGGDFSGAVIARDGFFSNHANAKITFRNISEFFNNSDDYPYLIDFD